MSAEAGRWPSSATEASTRPHSAMTSMASSAPRPAPPRSSGTSSPVQPAVWAVGQRSGGVAPSSASRAASIVLVRPSALRAASWRKICSSESSNSMSGPLPFLGPQLGEGDPLVQPRFRWQAEHPLAHGVAQDLLGPTGRLEAREERDEVGPLALLQRLGPEDVGD